MSGTDLELELGSERLVIRSDAVSPAKARELRLAIKEVAKAYDTKLEEFKKVLREIDKEYESRLAREKDAYGEYSEAYDVWIERINPVLEEKQEAVDAVTPEDKESHVMELAFECLKVIAAQFGQSQKVTPASFDAAKSWSRLKFTLAKFLINNECEMGVLFLPPKSLN